MKRIMRLNEPLEGRKLGDSLWMLNWLYQNGINDVRIMCQAGHHDTLHLGAFDEMLDLYKDKLSVTVETQEYIAESDFPSNMLVKPMILCETELPAQHIPNKPYFTYQLVSTSVGKHLTRDARNLGYSTDGGIDIFDNSYSLPELFSLIKHAKYHMTVDSGPAFAAVSVETPVKFIEAGCWKVTRDYIGEIGQVEYI